MTDLLPYALPAAAGLLALALAPAVVRIAVAEYLRRKPKL